MAKSKIDVVTEWFARVWKEQDSSAIDAMFVPDGRAEGLGAHTLVGPEGFKGFHKSMIRLLTDIEVTIDQYVEEGEWISYIGTFRGTSIETGKSIVFAGGAMCHIQDDKIVTAYNTWDFLSFLGQLGHMPLDALGRVLSDEPVAFQDSREPEMSH